MATPDLKAIAKDLRVQADLLDPPSTTSPSNPQAQLSASSIYRSTSCSDRKRSTRTAPRVHSSRPTPTWVHIPKAGKTRRSVALTTLHASR